ncbi:MAG: DMT family transporter [Gammaproteobacteria bacterium]|jgi:drug/metabolite transporter (DMT)-like permease|nr:DMT family transporter [Gammaproteobacteria bacterium]
MTTKPIGVLPVFSLLLGALFWGVVWYPLRLLEDQGLSGPWSALIIYGAAVLVGLAVLALRRSSPRPTAGLVLLAVASGWCNVSFIVAMLEGNVVRVLLLFYLAPLWTVLLARLMLGEVLSKSAGLTMALAFTGAMVMLWDPATGLPLPSGAADWLALSSGIAFALSNVTVRWLHEVPVWDKCVVGWLGVVLVAGAWLLVGGMAPPQAAGAVAGAVALGVFGMVFMTFAVIYGMTQMPAHRAAVILLFELVIGAASAQWLTDEHVRLNEWAGGALILVAAWIVARDQFVDVGDGRVIHPS